MNSVNIHQARSSRTRCEMCRKGIKKDEFRMEERTSFSFVDSVSSTKSLWYHLPHAADQRPRELIVALAEFEGSLPGRRKLKSHARALIKELDNFRTDSRWKTNDKGNLFIARKHWKLTIFKRRNGSFNWAFNGKPVNALAAFQGSSRRGEEKMKLFGPSFFNSSRAAQDDLYQFLRQNGGKKTE